jgi:hypothetical protein
VNEQPQERLERIIEQMKVAEGVTEDMKKSSVGLDKENE